MHRRSFEHRKQWIEDRLLELAKVFALDICAYAVMSNHYHVVLHINAAQSEAWTLREVVGRWHQLCKGSPLSQRFARNEALNAAELARLEEVVTEWRARLMDISCFMRMVNESIARQANREDGCTGSFWEGRFKSQALLDERALSACIAMLT
ncbi:hypothetical protein [Microbulbifer thermotolerans]|uniref:hypothetical protein n=1 Tax=Microbulbifer thermotolerans TaxID=252514 RepID=UPI000ABDBC52|nr:hypothetical protein [Microbulbifer thermotolerans]MCX2833054.1 hypothetical protein [Microbulbifer thermotolerans]WKT61894.1 hypothetical protein Q2E61_06770 [Microbulbifer thermotolerans]